MRNSAIDATTFDGGRRPRCPTRGTDWRGAFQRGRGDATAWMDLRPRAAFASGTETVGLRSSHSPLTRSRGIAGAAWRPPSETRALVGSQRTCLYRFDLDESLVRLSPGPIEGAVVQPGSRPGVPTLHNARCMLVSGIHFLSKE